MPWIDQLPGNWPGRKEVIFEYLHKARYYGYYDYTGKDFWIDYRLATKFYMHELLFRGYSRQELTRLLDEMSINEMEYVVQRILVCPPWPPGFAEPKLLYYHDYSCSLTMFDIKAPVSAISIVLIIVNMR